MFHPSGTHASILHLKVAYLTTFGIFLGDLWDILYYFLFPLLGLWASSNVDNPMTYHCEFLVQWEDFTSFKELMDYASCCPVDKLSQPTMFRFPKPICLLSLEVSSSSKVQNSFVVLKSYLFTSPSFFLANCKYIRGLVERGTNLHAILEVVAEERMKETQEKLSNSAQRFNENVLQTILINPNHVLQQTQEQNIHGGSS